MAHEKNSLIVPWMSSIAVQTLIRNSETRKSQGMIRDYMSARRVVVAACASLWLAVALGQEDAQPQNESAPSAATDTRVPVTVKVILKTSQGDIVLAVESERAPITAANFLRYVDQKRLDGSDFYRSMVLDEEGHYGLVQGGLRGNPKRVLKPISHEPTSATGLSHVNGAISMARADPGTATADFFLVIGDLVSLDAQPNGGDPGYAVFGHVIDGMDVVHAIFTQPRSPTAGEGVMQGQMLATPVKILTARRAD
jgi:peptidyl-prolyl cis-trans isomerase A (cyclophilin A)